MGTGFAVSICCMAPDLVSKNLKPTSYLRNYRFRWKDVWLRFIAIKYGLIGMPYFVPMHMVSWDSFWNILLPVLLYRGLAIHS